MKSPYQIQRRQLLSGAACGIAASWLPGKLMATPAALHTRPIPKSGEAIPIIGMGSWITLNVGDDPELRADRLKVVQAFFDEGGRMIDSSPMYGSSEEVIGWCMARIPARERLFATTKVWTPTRWLGEKQMEKSFALWGVDRFDLMQIHNLLDWDAHLETLLEWKAAGRIRYIGVTTSHGRRHDDLADIMETQPIDFVQFTYNVQDRAAEARLLPLAAERGIAVIINRPFRGGDLFNRVERQPLPPWAAEIGCANWAQFFLKFVVSHPTVTCAIPATSKVHHLLENMAAGRGTLPDSAMRARMLRHLEIL